MGKGHFCWEGLNSSVIVSDFYCNNTTFTLNNTGIWCNTEIIGKITCLRLMKPLVILILKKQYIGKLNLILPMKSFLWKLIGQKKIRTSR